jgi:hypothetical protein
VIDELTDGHLGGWLLGGRDAVSSASSRRVDHVNAGLAWDSPAPQELAVARVRPDAITLRFASGMTSAIWLVIGGQSGDDPLLETYSPSGTALALHLDDMTHETVDHRTGVAATCVSWSTEGCDRVLILGGTRSSDGAIASDDVVLDTSCVRTQGPSCPAIIARGTWLAHRRSGARAALAERTHVVVAGGHDAAMGAVFDVESIGVESSAAPETGHVVATLTVLDPAVLTLSNGNVAIAGGRRMNDNAASGDVWFYRD